MYLTNAKYRVIISQVAQSGVSHQKTWKNIKKSEKTFAKGIDKAFLVWYNIKVAAQVATSVIENWPTREKYKAIKNSMCIGSRTILNKRILLKQKVKLLRAKARCKKDWIDSGRFNTLISRVWSWLRMNAGGVHNTFKSNGQGTSVLR